jgi:predicted lipid-binding transport protein (Tim44 family)
MSTETSEGAANKLFLMFGAVAGALMIILALGMMYLAIFKPEVDTTGVSRMLDTQISLIIGGVLGWAARSTKGGEGGEANTPRSGVPASLPPSSPPASVPPVPPLERRKQ